MGISSRDTPEHRADQSFTDALACGSAPESKPRRPSRRFSLVYRGRKMQADGRTNRERSLGMTVETAVGPPLRGCARESQ